MKKILALLITAVMLLQLSVFVLADSSEAAPSNSDSTGDPLEITDTGDSSQNETPPEESSSDKNEPESSSETSPPPTTDNTDNDTVTEPDSESDTDPVEIPEGVKFNISGTTLIECTGDSNKVIVPDDIEHICAGAFEKMPNLLVVVIYNFHCTVDAGAFPTNVTVNTYKDTAAHKEAVRAGVRFNEIQRRTVNLTIEYRDHNNTPIHQTHKEVLKSGDQYMVTSPNKPGLTPDIPVVQGYAVREDIKVTVIYSVSDTDGWKIDGDRIKYTENGSFLKNTTKTLNGVTYKFDSYGFLALKDSFITIRDNTYYLDSNCKISRGYKVIGGAVYFFMGTGIMLSNVVHDGYRFDENGVLSGDDGPINIGSDTYYLKGNSLYSGFFELDGNIVCFGEDYSMVKNTTMGTYRFNEFGHLVSGITIEGLIFSALPNVEFTGEALTPSLTIKFGNIELREGVHYKLEYSDNVDAGDATVEIIGIGAVSGSKKLSFKIVGGNVFTLTIRYVNVADQPIAPDYVSKHAPGEKYEVYCPAVPGYIADHAVTTGTMPKGDVTLTVIYTPEDAEPDESASATIPEDTDPAETKPPVGSSIIGVEGTTQTTVEKENIIKTTYNWGLLVEVFIISTVICGGAILTIINWTAICRGLSKKFPKLFKNKAAKAK